jgi:hypothetical protein
MESFVTNFPTSAKSNQAYIEVAFIIKEVIRKHYNGFKSK